MYDVNLVEEFWVNLYKNKFAKEVLIICVITEYLE